MKKYTVWIMLILFLGLFQVAFGQGLPKFGVGGVLGFPTGNWGDLTNNVGFGGTAQVLVPVGENMAAGGHVGYIIFGGEDFERIIQGQTEKAKEEYDYSAIPILAQGRYYLGVPYGPRPFVGALVGFHIFSVSHKSENVPNVPDVDESNTETEFSFAPMGGIEIGGLEIAAFYMIISDANYFGGRIGFNFGPQ